MEEITLEEINVIVQIPKKAIKLSINATIMNDQGELETVSKALSIEEIQDARTDFLTNVLDGDDYDQEWVLTDKGKQFLEELKQAKKAE